jgi:hypothetical protein
MFIKNKSLYVLSDKENYIYSKHCEKEVDNCLKLKMNTFIETSFKQLPINESIILNNILGKNKSNLFSVKNMEKYLLHVKEMLTNNDIELNLTINQTHFQNGYIDLLTSEFHQRELNKHYITKYIKRNYVKSTDAQQNLINTHIRKIYPLQEDYDCMIEVFGSALTGLSSLDPSIQILIGEGSSAKSFIMLLTQASFEDYLVTLKSDSLVMNNGKLDKILNTYSDAPYIRFTWINEPKDNRVDESMIETFCDGQIETTELYQDGNKSFTHYSKLFCSSNTPMIYVLDTGINRKVRPYTHKSKFVDENEQDLVNESKNVYLKDKNQRTELVRCMGRYCLQRCKEMVQNKKY